MPRFIPLAALAAALTLSACQSDAPDRTETPAPVAEEDAIPFRQDGTLFFTRDGEILLDIAIEIADTDSAITRGLMERASLPERSGMLFLFPVEETQSFWMANTPLALDLFFIDADSQIVDIAKYAKPFSPDPIVSEAPAKYVLEVPAGFADTYGLIESDRVRWTRTDS